MLVFLAWYQPLSTTNNTVTKGTKLPESRTVIRKLSFAPRSRAALSLPIAVQFLRCRGRSLWFQRCDFRTAEQLFLLTTAAQNIHVFLPKLPLHKKHFFGWLKRAISSTACGTSTLKSPLLRAFFTPHVHSRLRKRLSRCTLDCGFKTLESPALRGFEVGPRALATAAFYLVLKSNGPHHSKNLPVKFDFSPIDTSATIAKKLPPQRCLKPLLIPIFNFTHKRPTFAFTGESGYTLGFAQRIAHKGTHGETRGVSDGGWYHYPRSVPHVHEHPRAGYQNGVLCRFWVLVGCTLEERRKPSGQRCAYARRCPEASRPRWAA